MEERVAMLERDVAAIKSELAAIRHSLRKRQEFDMSQLMSKADLYTFEARLKAWGIGLALAVIAANAGVNFAIYSSLKSLIQSNQQPRTHAAATVVRQPYFLPGW
jgi:hypothetical protein